MPPDNLRREWSLLKGHDPDGFIFYTNQQSRKAGDIAENPQAAILFHWKSLRRQIRIEGHLSTVADATADAYFATRSRDSQLGAWASDQSPPRWIAVQPSKPRFEEMMERFAGGDVPRPPHWSGYCLVPARFEFWQDQAHRLHERRVFVRNNEDWTDGLLYP